MNRALVVLVLLGASVASAQPAASGSAVGPAMPSTLPLPASAHPLPLPSSAGALKPITAPIADPSGGKPSTEPAHTTTQDSLVAIKIIGGLIALIVLAFLGGNRRVVRFQEQLGISGVITAGFPFVALGMIASLPSIGILSGDVLGKLRPVLHFGLGWLGFIIGAQLDIRVLDRVPKGTAYLILVEALGPFAVTAAGCGAVILAFGQSWDQPAVWRDVVLLGTAAAMTAPRKFRGFANRTWHEGRGVDVLLAQLDELVGVVGLLFITAYFRDDAATAWQLPDTVWIFISLGLGLAVGVLIFAMLRVPQSDPEFLALMLGGIAFASGLAGYLHLSPIVVCFLAGALITNFPNEQRDNVYRILAQLERPVHLLFLIIVGAVWDVGDWRGWVLVPLFVAGRAIGKGIGIFAAKTAVGASLPSSFADQRQLITPLSGLSIALVISIDALAKDEALPWVVTAVVAGSIVTEFLVARAPANDAAASAAPTAPIDELEESAPIDQLDDAHDDAVDGPIYRDEPPMPPRDPGHGGTR